MLHCSNGLIWYSARCWLLFWYARQSVLMEDDCSRVWRQFDGLWMRAHSVPLTAQDNALCSLLPLSHNLTHTLGSVTQHQDLQHCCTVTPNTKLLSSKFYFIVWCNKTYHSQTVCFQKLLFLEMNRLGLFLLFVCSAKEQWHSVVYRGILELKEDHI